MCHSYSCINGKSINTFSLVLMSHKKVLKLAVTCFSGPLGGSITMCEHNMDKSSLPFNLICCTSSRYSATISVFPLWFISRGVVDPPKLLVSRSSYGSVVPSKTWHTNLCLFRFVIFSVPLLHFYR